MGFFGGLVGQGGGVVGIPLMTSLGRLTQHQAHGTSLVAVASTGLAGALAYWQAGGAEEGVDTLAALMLAGSASLFAGLGARLSKRVSSPNLKKYMGAFMVAASVSVAVKAYSDYPDHRGSLTSTVASAASANAVASPVLSMSDKAALLTPARIATIGAIGAVTGFASGFLGIGGGLVMVPLLTLCTSMHQSQVLGTSLLAMVIPAVVGSWTHLRLGNVFVPIVPSMVAGTLVGGYLGGKLSTNLTQTQQRAIVSITIFTLALRMLRK